MKEVGDGLHEQMNCMMGALQELKLLQVQTALEHLELSEQRHCCRSSTGTGLGDTQGRCPPSLACPVPQPASLCQPAASQELCRKFSLTTNIFKKFLRSVRPDRDRLLKEKPCWLPPEDKQPHISKRSKKISKLKGTFYLPLHGNLQSHHSKAERCPRAEGRGELPKVGTRKVPEPRDYSQAGFDINTAVWV
ncbi:hypothetical protein EK904_000137 [Melospiza melodia maxima]|nr:hypothetical protein EK904_000137 [Melospiza melodia maxima]